MADLFQAYVAEGDGGLLKVGFTKNFARRLHKLRQEFKARGDVLARYHACEFIEAAKTVECVLIATLKKTLDRHSGREWFVRGDFAAAVALANEETANWASHRYLTPEDIARNLAATEGPALARAHALHLAACTPAVKHPKVSSPRHLESSSIQARAFPAGSRAARGFSSVVRHATNCPFFARASQP